MTKGQESDALHVGPDCIGGAARTGRNGRLGRVKIAHVRERNAPAGSPWRLAAARETGPDPRRWLDLEEARQRLVLEDPRRAHNAVLFRQPITTLDEHLARGLRVEALVEVVDGYAA